MGEENPVERSLGRRIVRMGLIILALFTLVGASAATGGYLWLRQGLPKLDKATDYAPILPTIVYDRNGRVVAEYGEQRRILVPIENVPRHVVHAFLAAEDASFYSHGGVNFLAIIRAAVKNLTSGGIKQGASTITQQVAKTFFLSSERKLIRKLREVVLAHRLEDVLTKDEILYLYLNQIYFGAGAYGVESAANTYFAKSITEVSVAEAAVLAGLPKAPSAYSPYENPRRARQRQLYVLDQMRQNGFLKAEEEKEAAAEQVAIRLWRNPAPESGHYAEQVRRYLMDAYGAEKVLTGGLRVETAMDFEMQKAAEKAVRDGIITIEKRHGYRGPTEHIEDDGKRAALLQKLERELRTPEVGGILHYIAEDNLGVPPAVEAPPARTMRAYVTDVTRQQAVVMVGQKQRAILPLFEAEWASPYNPWAKYDPHKDKTPPLTDLRRALQVGDVILVEAVDVPALKKGQELEKKRFEAWSKIKLGDAWPVTLVPAPEVQGALVAVDSDTAEVRAMVGGYDFGQSEFNRAMQARRQPGSSFKPIVYMTALERGYNPATMVVDSPDVYEQMATDSTTVTYWKPKNYDESFDGPITVREALMRSRNVPTLRITQDVGVSAIVDMASRLGIESDLAADMSLALGSSGVSLLELSKAYTTINAMGVRRELKMIRRVVTPQGEVLEQQVPDWVIEGRQPTDEERVLADETFYKAERIVDPEIDYMMIYLLKQVVQHGTGWRAKLLGRPAGGKTGTTNKNVDSLFMGFTADLVAGVWVGYDQPERNLGPHETGSVAASPIWVDFMLEAHRGLPVRDWEQPENIVFKDIDTRTGLLAGPTTLDRVSMPFVYGTEPSAPTMLEVRPTEVDLLNLDMGF